MRILWLSCTSGEIMTNENGEPLVALVGTDMGAGQKQRELCTALVAGAIAFAVSETLGLIAALSLLTSRMAPDADHLSKVVSRAPSSATKTATGQ